MWNPFREKSVVIVSHYASFAGAGEILTELRRRGEWDARLIVDRRDEHQEFWREYAPVYWPELDEPARRATTRELRRAALTIVAGACSLDLWTRILAGAADRRTSFRRAELDRALPDFYDHGVRHRTALLVSDSHYLVETERWNEHFARLEGVRLLLMPDLLPFADRSRAVPFWPVVDCRAAARSERNGAITVGHSPSKAARRGQKKEALARKARFAVFVDQVADRIFEPSSWHGGLGKSGLEALALGCSVITSGSVASTEPWFPDPPVVWTDRERFERDLLGLVRDPERVRELGARGRRWAATVATPRAMVDHILACSGLA
jgi:hypothetical protein